MADNGNGDKPAKEKEEEDEEKDIPVDKADLPYGGDRMKAIRAMDRAAIKLIMNWAQKYGQAKVVRREIKPIPEVAKSCKNEEDYILHERWGESNLPDIYIKYLNFNGEIEGIYCYKLADIKVMLDNPGNNFAAWVKPQPDAYFDENGFVIIPRETMTEQNKYAEASIVEHFVELPLRRIFLKISVRVALGLSLNGKYVATPIYQTRIGNLDASYAESRLHGQAPDSIIYYLAPEESLEIPRTTYGNIFREIYGMKTNKDYDENTENIKLEDIVNLQDTYPTAQADINYYWNRMTENDSLIHYPGIPVLLSPPGSPSYLQSYSPPSISSSSVASSLSYTYPHLPPTPEPESDFDEYGSVFPEDYDIYVEESPVILPDQTMELASDIGLEAIYPSYNNIFERYGISPIEYGYLNLYLKGIKIIVDSDGNFENITRGEIYEQEDHIISNPDEFMEFAGLPSKTNLDKKFKCLLEWSAGYVETLDPNSDEFRLTEMMARLYSMFIQGITFYFLDNPLNIIIYMGDEEQELPGYLHMDRFESIFNYGWERFFDLYKISEEIRDELDFHANQIGLNTILISREIRLEDFPFDCGESIFPNYEISEPHVYGLFNLLLSRIVLVRAETYFVGLLDEEIIENILIPEDFYILSAMENSMELMDGHNIRDTILNINPISYRLTEILCRSANQVADLDPNSEMYIKIKALMELFSILEKGGRIWLNKEDPSNYVIEMEISSSEILEETYELIYNLEGLFQYGINKFLAAYLGSELMRKNMEEAAQAREMISLGSLFSTPPSSPP